MGRGLVGRGLGRAGPGQTRLSRSAREAPRLAQSRYFQVRQVLPVSSQPGSADQEGGAPWRILHGQGSGTPVAQVGSLRQCLEGGMTMGRRGSLKPGPLPHGLPA